MQATPLQKDRVARRTPGKQTHARHVTRRHWLTTAAVGGASLPLVLTACGQPTSNTSAPKPAAGPATVQYLFNASGGPDLQVHLDLKDAYERKYPQRTLELIQVPNDPTLVEKLLAMLASNTEPDVFWNRVRTSQVFIRREVLANLDPYMKRDKIDKKDFWPSAIKAYTFNGGYFAYPTSASSNAVYYNKRHFAEAGLTPPPELEKKGTWDWNALLETSKKLTKTNAQGQKQFGFMRPGGLVLTVQYMWQNGGIPFTEDRKTCRLDSKECVGAVEFLVDLVRKHQVSPPIGAEGNPNFRTNFRVSMEQAGRYILPSLAPALESNSIEPGMVVAPKGPKQATTRGDDLGASILKSSKEMEATWDFAKLWGSDEGQLIVLKSNRSYTSRRSVARNQALLKQVLLPFEDAEAYLKGLERTEVFPVTPQFPDVMKIYATHLDAAYKGEETSRQAMEAACREIEPLLSQPF